MKPRVLVAGIGNIFLGDDAFGVEVVRLLARRSLPDEVRVVDFGIRGFDLACAMADDYDAIILVDAAPRGGAPGTLYVIEPEVPSADEANATIEGHSLDPVKVLRLAVTLGGKPRRVLVVGCEPSPLPADDDMEMGLSPPVQTAIAPAATMVEELVGKILDLRTKA